MFIRQPNGQRLMKLKASNDYDNLWLIRCVQQARAFRSVAPESSTVIFG